MYMSRKFKAKLCKYILFQIERGGGRGRERRNETERLTETDRKTETDRQRNTDRQKEAKIGREERSKKEKSRSFAFQKLLADKQRTTHGT